MSDEQRRREAAIRYFVGKFGDAVLLTCHPNLKLRSPDVFAVPPYGERQHWVLFTVGLSLTELDAPKRAKGPRYAELMMSLAADWEVDQGWAPHVLRFAAKRVLAGEWPVQGVVIFEEREPDRSEDWVYGVIIGASRQLESGACVPGLAQKDAAIHALYPLTVTQFERWRKHSLDMADLPEVIGRWRDMLT